jgi:hypothetical protein
MTTTATRDAGVRRIKPAELARELGVSRQAINDLQKRGKLPRSDDGLVDVDLARHAIANRVRPSGKTAGALTAPPPPAGNGTFSGMQADAEQVSYMEAKRQRESAEAKIAQLKLRQMEGELVSIEKVRAASMRMARMLRDSVLGVPSRIAQTLASESDSHQIEQTLMASLRRALDDIANLNVEDIKRLEE